MQYFSHILTLTEFKRFLTSQELWDMGVLAMNQPPLSSEAFSLLLCLKISILRLAQRGKPVIRQNHELSHYIPRKAWFNGQWCKYEISDRIFYLNYFPLQISSQKMRVQTLFRNFWCSPHITQVYLISDLYYKWVWRPGDIHSRFCP